VSTIKVDALQGTSGSDTAITLSGANATVGGTLAVTGIHTVGNNAVATSEGGAVTTSIVQGLIKAWARIDQTGTVAIDDSFSWSSLTDNGTADLTSTFSITMSNTNYAPTAMMNDGNYGGVQQCEYSATNTTTAMRTRTCNNWHDGSTTSDTNGIYFHIAGDLA
tara:strand:+ start:347 stop:838 length:492 start_codon:yes stop_codon:yes gene_type:complete